MSDAIAVGEVNTVMIQKLENDQSFKRQAEESGIHSAGSNFSSSTGRTADFTNDSQEDSKVSEREGIKIEIDETTEWCMHIGEVTDAEAFSIMQSSNVIGQDCKKELLDISSIEHSIRVPKLALGKLLKRQ